MAIIEYDKSLNITPEQRLKSLADSVRRAFEEIEITVGDSEETIMDEDAYPRAGGVIEGDAIVDGTFAVRGNRVTLFGEPEEDGFVVGGGKPAYFKTAYGSGDDETALMNSLIEVGGGRNRFGNSRSGILKIVLPQDLTAATMVAFDVEIFSYSKQTLATYSFGGQIYRSSSAEETGGNWGYRSYNVQGSSLSSSGLANLQINFGRHNGKAAVSIGLADTVWNYSMATIKNVRTFLNSKWRTEYWSDGWDIVLDTNPLDTVMHTYDNPAMKSAAAGIQKKLLWTNASSTSSFSAQTISLDLSGYDSIEIIATYSTSATALTASEFVDVGKDIILSVPAGYENNTAMVMRGRRIYATSTGVTVDLAYSHTFTASTATSSSTYLIPYKIYGIKGVQ